jgi:putative MATE family efflux protein
MEKNCQSKLGATSVKKLVWTMGLPMIFSMVFQALYNVVDTAFVINMGEGGEEANLALSYAFPIQILMIAIGIGLGVGINALLSRSLGKGDREAAGKAAGNGIFLAVIFYLVFLFFGLFGAEPFIRSQASSAISDPEQLETVASMGGDYLMICCTLSIGQMLFTVYERFLQATGKTMLSAVGQFAGAVTNIVLDYVMIYPLGLGVRGAAYATVIGQFVSFIIDAAFHYFLNKEIPNGFRYLIPAKGTMKEIAVLGLPAMLMQALLSVMMFGSNLIIGTSVGDKVVLQGAFGIYYKIQQISLFACFGMSNALITASSFAYGEKNGSRLNEIMRYGIIDTLIVALCLTVFFEALANPIVALFGMASGDSAEDVVNTCVIAIRISSLGFIFMGASVAIQGVLQGLHEVWSPLLISLLRLAVFVFPLEFAFSRGSNANDLFWISFPVSEVLTCGIAFLLMKRAKAKKIAPLIAEEDASSKEKKSSEA